MKKITLIVLMLFTTLSYAQDIELNGTISAQSNQIKNVADPTQAQDAATKVYVDGVVITTQQASDITTNTAKVGITGQQASDITSNTAKTVITTDQANAIVANMAKVGITAYSIGDFAHGGIVFWVDETGQHGLVCTKEDQIGGVRWHAGANGNTQAKGDGIYAGKANTSIIISSLIALGDDGNTYAARICNELQITEFGDTYGDWYLPSKHELNLMYQNKSEINTTAGQNGGGVFSESRYFWSSTELASDQAYAQSFFDSDQSNSPKYLSTLAVRAVRAF